ncbi:cation:proton antiporter [Kutzneria buriramensis]|uniref:Kef-type K+ transport system membrane component KefB n=1 Tax=Kutzneria buriramensis TaxID=1045776 RepID=A0A3E0HL13_9PSEU|nr:cation:proton antiporter [Kutzneria buriramensis]REH46896.1 Kef-type K+ transport system membrane component KefB [Kutzneria buriramensis]
MSLFTLALVLAVGLAGPLLATPKRFRVPVVVGEIAFGVVLGRTGLGWVDADEPALSFLASAGFALVMLVAGSHVPLRNAALRVALRRGALLAGLVGVLAVPAGLGVAALTGTGHGLLYAVLLASSSAALVMPVIDEKGLDTPAAIATIVHVAIADTACIVLLPLAEDPSRAGRAGLGALAVIGVGAAWFAAMRWLRARGVTERVHKLSKRRHFGIELRIALISVFGLAGLAQLVGVSVMLAGFVIGLALAAEGEPRRLARQLFAVADGFLGPVFFVWLGASLDLRALASQPRMIILALLLAVATVMVHAAARLLGQPLPLALLAGAQMGVPVAAVTIGTRANLLESGEGGAILAAAMVSVAVTAWAATRAAGSPGPAPSTGGDTRRDTS